jgi:hypothetical protein
VLLAVAAIVVTAVVAAAAIVIAAPEPGVTRARPPTPSPMGSPSASHVPKAPPAPTGPGGAFSFLDVTVDNGQRVPIRWNPCQPIEYQLEFQVRPAGALGAIRTALERTSAATRIRFRLDGATSVDPHRLFKTSFLADATDNVYRPVLLAVVSGAAFDSFGTSKRAVAFTHPEEGTGGLDKQYVAGIVVVDGSVRFAERGRWSLTLVVQHELGHLMGLGHVRARDELMFSYEEAPNTIPEPIFGWGPGDRQGLERLGADEGCLQTARVRG